MSIRVPARDRFPLTVEQLAVLGEVAALGALIEAVADGILCTLVTAERQGIALVVAGQPVTWFLEKINLLADRWPQEAASLKTWVTRCRTPLEGRNMLVHATWLMEAPGMPGVAVGQLRRRKGATWHFKSLEEMVVIRDSLLAVYEEGLAIAHRVQGIDPDAFDWSVLQPAPADEPSDVQPSSDDQIG